jgi:hypothetical protein
MQKCHRTKELPIGAKALFKAHRYLMRQLEKLHNSAEFYEHTPEASDRHWALNDAIGLIELRYLKFPGAKRDDLTKYHG